MFDMCERVCVCNDIEKCVYVRAEGVVGCCEIEWKMAIKANLNGNCNWIVFSFFSFQVLNKNLIFLTKKLMSQNYLVRLSIKCYFVNQPKTENINIIPSYTKIVSDCRFRGRCYEHF